MSVVSDTVSDESTETVTLVCRPGASQYPAHLRRLHHPLSEVLYTTPTYFKMYGYSRPSCPRVVTQSLLVNNGSVHHDLFAISITATYRRLFV